jgi:hypothetical protein
MQGSRAASTAATPLSRTPSPGPRVVYAAPVLREESREREERREQEEPPVQQENAHMLSREREERREREEPPVQQGNAHMLRRNGGVLLRQARMLTYADVC